jgi:hypothetical protein
MARCVTTVGNEMEARIVVERLAEARIHAMFEQLLQRAAETSGD